MAPLEVSLIAHHVIDRSSTASSYCCPYDEIVDESPVKLDLRHVAARQRYFTIGVPWMSTAGSPFASMMNVGLSRSKFSPCTSARSSEPVATVLSPSVTLAAGASAAAASAAACDGAPFPPRTSLPWEALLRTRPASAPLRKDVLIACALWACTLRRSYQPLPLTEPSSDRRRPTSTRCTRAGASRTLRR